MELEKIVGEYEEVGVWKDSEGNAGNLAGNIQEIRFESNKLYFCYASSKETQVSDDIVSQDLPINTMGNFGKGKLFISNESIILDYEADIEGRVERNTDVWSFTGDTVKRYGVIRQDTRAIWFEATMKRLS